MEKHQEICQFKQVCFCYAQVHSIVVTNIFSDCIVYRKKQQIIDDGLQGMCVINYTLSTERTCRGPIKIGFVSRNPARAYS